MTKTTRTPAKKTGKTRTPAPKPKAPAPAKTPRARDPRLPAPGTVLVRPYKGKDHRVTVLEDGFRHDGTEYRSLSKLASAITGQPSINGFLWMRLTEPKEQKAAPAPKRARAKKAAPAEPAAAPQEEVARAE